MSRIFSLLSYETDRFILLKVQKAIGPGADCFKCKELTVQTGEGNGNPFQYSCLKYPMDRGAWQATVHGVARVGHDLATKPPPPLWTSGSLQIGIHSKAQATPFSDDIKNLRQLKNTL